MPLIAKTEQEMTAGVAAMNVDLVQELRRQGVKEKTIGVLGIYEFTTVKKFQCFGRRKKESARTAAS